MDILKEFINNPGLEHLAENIIRNMDVDKAMETMIESKLLSDEERKVFGKLLRKWMVEEAELLCEKGVVVDTHSYYLGDQLLEFKEALKELKKSESFESLNRLYDILVWLSIWIDFERLN